MLKKKKVASHPKFERHGSDIHVAVDVPIHIAMLGGTVTVPTLTGEAEVRVKSGTQHDHKEVMRSKGITEHGTFRTGHQYLHFNVIIPKNLTETQKQLMEEFAKIEESKKQKT
ncbi:hypothetical protein RFI_14739 [Reticulomyxa filosa]|uniref:Chaperone DnaJ C-terminal domain-containing protein n=1 Tax=Reticulomyxa filosa TaxID=46433 RepID=X6N8V6_RETFI|nr:hypothetical protein RFI_14739 [Reticulomyxa filosa]|eukprot:ETO22461.1 hypothetical protein RFI_14739 [Reticulomyxa filosa]